MEARAVAAHQGRKRSLAGPPVPRHAAVPRLPRARRDLGMGESRDANDPRDQLRAMNKEARAEFEDMEMTDTGGQEHASRDDREGRPEAPAERRAGADPSSRATREQDDSERPRVPEGGDASPASPAPPGASRNANGSGDGG